ncbi:Arm DNA-binding domain-containing protein [Roseateles sp.]|uniref:Arm DNA-binding domain-containing protein n=1 Tax=Roseateles sp. TaxID=1971397 RepID=UPI002ED94A36
MLRGMQLRALKPTGKVFKVADAHGLYAAVTRTGVVSFRFDYRLHARRETLVIGKYDPTHGARKTRDTDQLSYGLPVSLAEARQLRSVRPCMHRAASVYVASQLQRIASSS